MSKEPPPPPAKGSASGAPELGVWSSEPFERSLETGTPPTHVAVNALGNQHSRAVALAVTPVAVPALASSTRCDATLLFADLFGYTALTEEREMEHVAALVGELKVQASRIVHAHGGIVNQFVGDEVMAVFGFPKGHEDGPRRAVEAALEMHELVRASNLEAWLGPERRLRLHSGIDTGLVLIRTRDVRNGLFELTGRAVVRAAKLRSAAAADEVLISEEVKARVAAVFETEPRELQDRSAGQAATVFRVLRRQTSEVRLRARRARDISARSELSDLRRFWDEHGSRRGGVVVVKGAAGSGKSRLLASFGLQLASGGAEVWTTRGRDHDCEPFSTLARVTSPCTDDTPASASGAAAAQNARYSAQSLWALAPARVGERQQGNEPRNAAELVDRLCSQLSQHIEDTSRHHVLLVDDLQWVDPSSLTALVQVANRVCPLGLVLVCAARDNEDCQASFDRLQAAVADDSYRTILLGPLSADDAGTLVAEQLGLQQLSGQHLLERLSALSDGTPLSLVELLNQLLEDNRLQTHDGTWQLDSALLAGLDLSPNADGLITRRLRALPADAKSLLRAAAIMGEGTELDLLARTAELSPAHSRGALDAAVRARLVELDGGGNLSFAHDLIWEAVLRDMPDSEQRSWHRRAAEALRALPTPAPKHQWALGKHCAAGTLETDPRGSFDALWHAAQLALQAHDDALALSFLTPAARASELAGHDPGHDFFAALGETALRLGEQEMAVDALSAAAARSADPLERAHLLGRKALIRHYQAQSTAQAMLEEALRECGEPVARFEAGALLSAAGLRIGSTLHKAGAQLPSRRAEILCGIYHSLVRVYADSGNAARALAAMLRLSVIAEQLPEGRLRASADAMRGALLGIVGLRTASHDALERCRASAVQLHDPVSLAYYHQLSHVLALLQGRFEDGEQHAAECVVARAPFMEVSELCLVCLGEYLTERYRGRTEQALAWAWRAVERVLQLGHAPAVFALIEESLCGLLVSHGRHAEVVRLKSRLRFVKRTPLGHSGFHYLVSFPTRASYLCTGAVPNPELDALVAELAQLCQSPKQAPMGTLVFYTQVAHVRLTQCLRTRAEQRQHYLGKLRDALADLKASERVPAMQGHRKLIEAAVAWLQGDARRAQTLLTECEAAARTYGLPWVSCAAARVRAHMLREQGLHESALDEARVAALHARQHGQWDLLRLIEEELPPSTPAQPGGVTLK